MKYWIGVASEEHVKIGVTGGFCQLCHGKLAPLRRMNTGDWLVYYAPKISLKGSEICQKFVAIGQVISEEVYQVEMYPGFFPHRRDMKYLEIPGKCSLSQISQSPLWKHYRSYLRYGHFEISVELFQQIAFFCGLT